MKIFNIIMSNELSKKQLNYNKAIKKTYKQSIISKILMRNIKILMKTQLKLIMFWNNRILRKNSSNNLLLL